MEKEKLKRVNISLNQSLAKAFDEFAQKSGLSKSILIKDFIKVDNGRFEATLISSNDKTVSYNFKIEEVIYKQVVDLAKNHLTSVSNILRLIIAKNIQISDKSLELSLLLEEKMKKCFESFKDFSTRIHDLDSTVELLHEYSKAKNHKGFNFSTIKTFSIKNDLKKISNKLHAYQAHTMNLFLSNQNMINANQIEMSLKDISKMISKYEVSTQYYETAIEYYETQNPFFTKGKRKTKFHEILMESSMGKSEICEFLSDIKSNALISMGRDISKSIDSLEAKTFKISCLGPASYTGIFYILIGFSEELSIEQRKNFKAEIDIYESAYPKDSMSKVTLQEKIFDIRVKDKIIQTSLNDLVKSLEFKNIHFNFHSMSLNGPRGAYLNMDKFITDLFRQGKIYDINIIPSAEVIYPFGKTISLIKSYSEPDTIIASSSVIYSGDEAPRIFHSDGQKRIENKLFSASFRKMHHFLIDTSRDKYWLPLVMRPDLRVELNDFFHNEEEKAEKLKDMNNKGLYFQNTEKETHQLQNPFGCLTLAPQKAKFVMKKEDSVNVQNQTADYQCSTAVIKIL